MHPNGPLGCTSRVGNVRKDYEELFARIDRQEVPAGLLDRIMLRIGDARRRKIIRTRMFFFGSFSVFSLFAIVPAWGAFQGEMARSGFLQFLSLLFSDSAVALANWREFSFSLLESLPVTGTVMVLASVFALMFFARLLARDMRDVFMPGRIKG